jgi:hypothetical protein
MELSNVHELLNAGEKRKEISENGVEEEEEEEEVYYSR